MLALPPRQPARSLAGTLVAAVLLACTSALRTVPLGPRGARAPIVVQSPPPSAKVETIPKDPGPDCAYWDGRWDWINGAWEWQAGAWVRVPEGCHFAQPEAYWSATSGRGLLFYLPGRWYREDGSQCAEPVPCGRVGAPTTTVPETP